MKKFELEKRSELEAADREGEFELRKIIVTE